MEGKQVHFSVITGVVPDLWQKGRLGVAPLTSCSWVFSDCEATEWHNHTALLAFREENTPLSFLKRNRLEAERRQSQRSLSQSGQHTCTRGTQSTAFVHRVGEVGLWSKDEAALGT